MGGWPRLLLLPPPSAVSFVASSVSVSQTAAGWLGGPTPGAWRRNRNVYIGRRYCHRDGCEVAQTSTASATVTAKLGHDAPAAPRSPSPPTSPSPTRRRSSSWQRKRAQLRKSHHRAPLHAIGIDTSASVVLSPWRELSWSPATGAPAVLTSSPAGPDVTGKMHARGHGDEVPLGESQFPALVLNADFQPLSYLPLSLWPWQEAIKASLLGRVHVVAEYDRLVRAPSRSMRLPAVISLKEFQQSASARVPFTRFNVFLRDDFQCQYCGNRGPVKNLTFDHVVPRSRGGRTCWHNVVSACSGCNRRKGGRLLNEMKDMRLRRPPHEPRHLQLQAIARKYPPRYLHETWVDYLFWDTPLEKDAEPDKEEAER
ncbi:hypothetical protein CDCA_CDCA15G4030 [Cyanidium caldarium]|uniref:HNH nuclease domain-containing protein n=1 Tax=Cyanidium caldarium TaxID=2771 RepID=A0AAV9J111_CYACA|nr:hypothetical protein CDCA_CDCA15G4030 [Cyanidium caldarium]